jgi:hypothetical protein
MRLKIPPVAQAVSVPDAPALLGRSKELGAVAPGKVGDLAILDSDPLSNIYSVRNVKVVVEGGKDRPRSSLAYVAGLVRLITTRMP